LQLLLAKLDIDQRQGKRMEARDLLGPIYNWFTEGFDAPDLKVTVDYDTAKAILIEGNPQVGMQAFMAGKVKVEGDMAKLMALQAAPAGADATAAEMANRLKEITA